jgi:hypothetical protein
MSLFWSLEFWSFHFNHRNPQCMKKWKTFSPTKLGFRLLLSNKNSICYCQHTFDHLLPELNSNWNLQTPGFKLQRLIFYTDSYTKNHKSKRKTIPTGLYKNGHKQAEAISASVWKWTQHPATQYVSFGTKGLKTQTVFRQDCPFTVPLS